MPKREDLSGMTPEEKKERHRIQNRNWMRRKRATETEQEKQARVQNEKEITRRKRINDKKKRNSAIEELKAGCMPASPPKYVNTATAAEMLGVSTDRVRRWAKDGLINYIVTPGGARRFETESLHQTRHQDEEAYIQTAPRNFDVITTYKELEDYTKEFAAGDVSFLLLVGRPGTGKSEQMKADMSGKRCVWVKGHISKFNLYCRVYEAHNRHVVLDDVNHLINDKQSCSLVKALTETTDIRSINWESSAKELQEKNIPTQFNTESPICLIGNTWNSKSDDYLAIRQRAEAVAFYPSSASLHERVIELRWCNDSEILDFMGSFVNRVPSLSMRDYYHAAKWKKRGWDWRMKTMRHWGISPEYQEADLGFSRNVSVPDEVIQDSLSELSSVSSQDSEFVDWL